MPLSAGIPFGIVLVIIGAGLYALTRRKRLSLALVGLGAALLLFTLLAVVLAVYSAM